MFILALLPLVWFLHAASPACDSDSVRRLSHGADACTRMDRWSHVD